MKKVLIVFGLFLGFATAVYAKSFCCGGGKTKEQRCAERGKVYCPDENVCRTRCLEVVTEEGKSDVCVSGCINPDGKCCTWCPSAEVCAKMGKCQKIGADGCYTCGTCEEECPAPKCLNQDWVCCDSCPRMCPEGECLTNVDGCYQCKECKKPLPDDDDADDDDDDDDDDTPPPPPGDDDDDEGCISDRDCGHCEICVQGSFQIDRCCEVSCDLTKCEECNPETGACESKMSMKQTGECCDEGEVDCCSLTENCECFPTKDDCNPDDDDDDDDDAADDDDDDDDDDDVDDDDADDDDDDDDDADDDVDDDDDDDLPNDLCDGKPPVVDCMKCDSSTGDYTIGGCSDGQECCGNKCIAKCQAGNCEKCDSSAQACVKDEANCGNCKNEWIAADCYESQTFKCLGTCYLKSKQEGVGYSFSGINSCSGVDITNSSVYRTTTQYTRGCCEQGKSVCGPAGGVQECCDACNADNTGYCEASKVCGEGESKKCCPAGCDETGKDCKIGSRCKQLLTEMSSYPNRSCEVCFVYPPILETCPNGKQGSKGGCLVCCKYYSSLLKDWVTDTDFALEDLECPE